MIKTRIFIECLIKIDNSKKTIDIDLLLNKLSYFLISLIDSTFLNMNAFTQFIIM